MAANSVRCPRDRGESVKGGNPPCHKSTMTNRNSPPRAAGAQGSFDCRREAPGGPRTGPQLQAELRPKAIPDQGPVRGPLDPDCRSEAPTGRTGQRSMSARFCSVGDAWGRSRERLRRGAALSGRVSRSRAMPVGDRRTAGGPALHAVRHPALEGFARGAAFSQQGWCGTHVGGGIYGRILPAMATMTIKSTYSLDVGTVRTLEGLARRWNVSKSEALRRAIRSEAERQPSRADARLQALRALQASVAARGVDLDGWERQTKEIRSASFPRLAGEPR